MSTPEIENSEYEWNSGFGDTNYVVNLTVKGGSMLSVEIEETVSNERWSGDFTSQYVEEITHKAGNFKKFSVFCKMLVSALDKENDSVYVDVLTYADLETLKARKAGNENIIKDTSAVPAVAATTAVKTKSQMKRYVILTYRSDFDRVHFPLPLSYEDTPNHEAMRRTIRRLRELIDSREKEGYPADFLGEKDLRSMIANLRQENQELRHRMRQAESRTAKATAGSGMVPGSAQIANTIGEMSKINTELMTQNSKLKRQIDSNKRELAAADANFEKVRIELSKEVSKWKMRALENTGGAGAGIGSGTSITGTGSGSGNVGAGASGVTDRLDRYGTGTGAGRDHSGSTDESLRKRIQALERQLKLERLATAQARRTNSTGRSGPTRSATPPPSRPSGVWSPATGSSMGSRSRSDLPARQVSRSPATAAYQNRLKRQDPYNDPQAKESRLRAAALAARAREVRRSNGSATSRDTTPRSSSAPVPPRARSVSPALHSSSRGGRFDPTAYQRAKEDRQAKSLAQNKSPSLHNSNGSAGVGSSRDRDYHSGYDSTDSHDMRRRTLTHPQTMRKSSPSSSSAAQARKSTTTKSTTPIDGPSPSSQKVVRRKGSSKNSGGSGSRSIRGAVGETSRGILSGSDSEDDRLHRRTARTADIERENDHSTTDKGSEGGGGGYRAGIAEKNAMSSRRNTNSHMQDSKGGAVSYHGNTSVASKTVGDFPFPSGLDETSDNEYSAPVIVRGGAVIAASNSNNRISPTRVLSPSHSQQLKQPTGEGSPVRSSAESLNHKSRTHLDESLEQILPPSPTSFSHIRSSGYGELDGYVDAAKSPRFVESLAGKANSPLRNSKNGIGKSPSHSPKQTPRSSREGLSVSFSSSNSQSAEFRKTPNSSKGGDTEIQEIDQRIQALQSYLDNARTGLLGAGSGTH